MLSHLSNGSIFSSKGNSLSPTNCFTCNSRQRSWTSWWRPTSSRSSCTKEKGKQNDYVVLLTAALTLKSSWCLILMRFQSIWYRCTNWGPTHIHIQDDKKKKNNNSTKDAINQAIYKIKGVSFRLTLTTQLIKPNYPIYKTSEMLRATRLVKNLSFRPIENQNILRFVLSLFNK